MSFVCCFKFKIMDKYIKRSLLIIRGEFETNESSFNHALNELRNRIKELTPLFNECIEKCISIQEISPELNEEWNEIILVISKHK